MSLPPSPPLELNIHFIPPTTTIAMNTPMPIFNHTSHIHSLLAPVCRPITYPIHLTNSCYYLSGVNWSIKLPKPAKPVSVTEMTNQTSTFNRSLSNQIFLRGKDASTVDLSTFEDSQLYARWVPSYGRFHSAWQRNSYNEIEQSVTLLSNSQTPLKPLNAVVSKAWNMFASRAYVHQYAKHGITDDDFVDSFVALEQVVKNYSNL